MIEIELEYNKNSFKLPMLGQRIDIYFKKHINV